MTSEENPIYRGEIQTDEATYMSLYEVERQGKKFLENVQRIDYRWSLDDRFAKPTIEQVAKQREQERKQMMVNYPEYFAPQGEDYLTLSYL